MTPDPAPTRLFTPRFFVMCGFSFTVFVSAFFLLPTTPLRVLSLGGSTLAAGLFLGLLTYASAASGPFTGAVADRLGRRRVLLCTSLVLTLFSLAYGVTRDYRVYLALAVVHGVVWSGLLAASAAYVSDLIPENRRAEGIGYWGLASVAAIAVAPNLGLWLYDRGWAWVCGAAAALNVLMAAIAYVLPEVRLRARSAPGGGVLERRVFLASGTLFLYSLGYGGVTSFAALYAERSGVHPRGLYFTALGIVILLSRPLLAPLADRFGTHRVLVPCLLCISAGLALLAVGGSRPWLLASAVVFGLGFGTAYPAFVAHVLRHVAPSRRGAAFGSILAAFDTGIGTGSVATGWLIHRYGFGTAFGAAAALALLAAPYFLVVERRLFGEG
jgi:MFS family permease